VSINVYLTEDGVSFANKYDNFGPGLSGTSKVVREFANVGNHLVFVLCNCCAAHASTYRDVGVVGGCTDVCIEYQGLTFEAVDTAPVVVLKLAKLLHRELSQLKAGEG